MSGDRSSSNNPSAGSSSRWRDRMLKTSRDALNGAIDEINGQSDCLRGMMSEGAPVSAVKMEFETWTLYVSEAVEISAEVAKYLRSEDKDSFDGEFADFIGGNDIFKADVERYLQARDPLSPPSGPGLIQEIPLTSESCDNNNLGNVHSSNSVRFDSRYDEALNMNANCNRFPSAPPDFDCPRYPQSGNSRPSTGYSARGSESYDRSLVPVANTRPADPELSILQRLADILQSREERLPQFEPDQFNGDLLKFPAWISSFEIMVESRARSDKERLFYLSKFVTGKAREAIEGLLSLHDQPDSYLRAKARLVQRFGDKMRIADAFRRKLYEWPYMKRDDRETLQKFSDFLWQCHAAMQSISYLQHLDSREENKKLNAKLPHDIALRWERKADKMLYPEDPESLDWERQPARDFPTFRDFCHFVAAEARLSSSSNVGRSRDYSSSGGNDTKRQGSAAHSSSAPRRFTYSQGVNERSDSQGATGGTPGRPRFIPKCFHCHGPHFINECNTFLQKTREEKVVQAKRLGLCFGCLRRGHRSEDCTHKNPRLMQDGGPKAPARASTMAISTTQSEDQASSTDVKDDSHDSATVMKIDLSGPARFSTLIMPVYISSLTDDDEDTRILTYAMLDTQSSGCFVLDKFMDRLNLPTSRTTLELTTIDSVTRLDTKQTSSLQVKGMMGGPYISLPTCFGKESIACPPSHVPTAVDVERWPHLSELTPYFRPNDTSKEIGLLIGFDCPGVFRPSECLYDPYNFAAPFAIRYPLGWAVMGSLEGAPPEKQADKVQCFDVEARQLTIADLQRAFDVEFPKTPAEAVSFSQRDKKFMNIMERERKVLPSGKIELPLPLIDEPDELPPSRPQAVKRLLSQKKKFERDPVYHRHYCTFMDNMFAALHAEPVPVWDLDNPKALYLPHHGVYHPKKVDQLRVVHDPSAENEGVSLNKLLLSGPDLTNSLIGVLLRFREEKNGLICDVEKMFYQVEMTRRYRNFTRFVWFHKGRLDGKITDYRMAVHLFGATSSPGCANYALRYIADLHEPTYGKTAADFLRTCFYVDDGLGSMSSTQDTIDLVHSSHGICAAGGMNLRKYGSNNPAVNREIPEELKASELRKFEQDPEIQPIAGALGMGWCMKTDTLRYLLTLVLKADTRRGYLSSLSAIYDPLGLIGPVLLVGRMILQELCLARFQWDDLVPDNVRYRWRQWYTQLEELKTLEIPRCLRKLAPLPLLLVILHVFVDASSKGYGACCYLQLGEGDELDTNLVFAKSRVAPTKAITIPRLELQAAVLGVKTAFMVAEEFRYPEIKFKYYSDSKAALAYIANDHRRFHPFVANRAGFIRDHTDVKDWNYIPTDQNPADLASRGCSPTELKASNLWWHGPGIIKAKVIENVAVVNFDEYLRDDDPEIKQSKHVMATGVTVSVNYLHRFFSGLRSWNVARGVMARVLQFKSRFIRKFRPEREVNSVDYDVALLQRAESELVKLVQKKSYPEAVQFLSVERYPESNLEARDRRRRLKLSTNLHRLDAYVDVEGVLRVGGRLKRSHLDHAIRHPAILPSKDDLVFKLIHHLHSQTAHGGRNVTLSKVRLAGFWICGGRTAVGSVVGSCARCRRIRGRPVQQLMAELPEDRTSEQAPFTYASVDFFGPHIVRRCRTDMKRYGCLFVCQASRAVHLEMTWSLSTDSFLKAYRRFECKRGPIRVLRSDRGTNLTGVPGELEQALNQMDHGRLAREMLKDNCDWIHQQFNPPRAPHMGGSWERLVRSVKEAIDGLMDGRAKRLSDEDLITLYAEAEAVVNGRPLTVIDQSDADAGTPLTPMQLLTLKGDAVAPLPGEFEETDVYARKRWRTVQYLATEFWNRWRQSYLPGLQPRGKWLHPQRNLQPNDVVLIIDENLPRNKWSIGKVSEPLPSQDGLVRKAKVIIGEGEFERPVAKLILLVEGDRESPSRRPDVRLTP